MTEKDKAVDKIKKLLNLSKSDQQHEASLALEKAKELMNKYEITLSDVTLSDVKESDSKFLKNKNITDYQAMLLRGISMLFSCEPHLSIEYQNYTPKAKAVFIGIEPNPEIASYCFDVLNRQMEQARTEYLKTLSKRTKKANASRKANDYALGWANGVLGTVRRLVPEPQVPDIVNQYITKTQSSNWKKTTARTSTSSGKKGFKAQWEGFIEGKKVELSKGMSTTETKQLY